MVPRITKLCEKELASLQKEGHIRVAAFSVDLIPLETDVMSLELDKSFREYVLEADTTPLFYAAKSIMKLQSLYGVIPSIRGKGSAAEQVVKSILRMRKETSIAPGAEAIKQLILIDRVCDLFTILPTMLTYEGLVDEVYSIQSGICQLPTVFFPGKDGKPQPPSDDPTKMFTTYALNSNDRVFRDLRDANFLKVSSIISERVLSVKSDYDERFTVLGTNQSTSTMKNYMGKMKNTTQDHRALSIHLGVAQALRDVTHSFDFQNQISVEQGLLKEIGFDESLVFIETCIYQQMSLEKVLRLLSMVSVVFGGLKEKVYKHFEHEICLTYGYEHAITMANFEKVGLIRRPDNRNISPYSDLRDDWKLYVPDVSEVNPDDIAYVYSGYAPLSVRMVESSFQYTLPSSGAVDKLLPGWGSTKQVENLLQQVPGPTFHCLQSTSSTCLPSNENLTLVYFVGGITATEISALRFVAQRTGKNIVIATTNITNGNEFILSLTEQ